MLKRCSKKDGSDRIRNELLRILKDTGSLFVSGESVSRDLGVSRAALWKHVEALRRDGYLVESFPRKGYRLKSVPDLIIPEEVYIRLSPGLSDVVKILPHRSLVSTNDTACSLASDGAEEWTVVTSETQGGGRGRRGRTWVSPCGGLYFSVVLRPEMRLDDIPAMTLVAASSVARALETVSGCKVMIKWPNDIFMNGKKVSGILAETRAEPDRTDFVVLGIGVNVNTSSEELPESATSVKNETGTALDRSSLLAAILNEIGSSYRLFLSEGFQPFRSEARERSCVIGRKVSVETSRDRKEGEAVDIDERGALIVRERSGGLCKAFSGDVVVFSF
ncbi:MAG TPA: biotin--[acetyl-CoA-carboxylase] ligase [Candidatus Omnitrophota bacterium]|nr:biotin--[acetyl-CoA-carboxylase] ligase [Candidatus Omnitrophota bacterium]